MVKAIWNDVIIAESDDTVIVENNHYFPYDAVKSEYLTESDYTSFCPWKGTANYYTLSVGGQENKDAAWYYIDPKEKAKSIAGRIAFWRGVHVTE